VVLSDALPVQFWPSNCDTFNEKEVDGVFSRCFCQSFNCDDELVLQLKDTTGRSYKLNIFSDEGELLEQKSFVESGTSGVYYLVFTLVSYCDRVISFGIVDTNAAEGTYVDSSLNSFSGWSNSGSGYNWRIPTYVLPTKSRKSSTLSTNVISGNTYTISFDITADYDAEVTFKFTKSAGSGEQLVQPGTFGTGSWSVNFTASDTFNVVEVIYGYSTSGVQYDTSIPAGDIDFSLDDIDIDFFVILSNPDFTGSISPWANEGTGVDWTWEPDQVVFTTSTPGASSKRLVQALSTPISSGSNIVATVSITTANSVDTIGFSDDNITYQFFTITAGVATGTLSATANYVCFRSSKTGGPGTATVVISSVSINVLLGIPTWPGTGSDWSFQGSGYDWNANNISFTHPPKEFAVEFLDQGISNNATKTISIPSGVTVQYAVQVQASTDDTDPMEIDFTIHLKNGGNVLHTITDSVTNETAKTIFGFIDTTQSINTITIFAENTGTADRVDFNIIDIEFSLYNEVAKSDCVDVKEDHDETVLITYSNNRPFDSLSSSVGTPDHAFNLRIPAVFFKERFPEESEVIELSDSRSIQLNAQVKAQRFLNVGPMPFYMHRKTKLALTFGTVTIDNQDWVKEEAYEVQDTKRTHPLSKAQCWLTEKDTLYRNVL
jgi:hypothetical protein